MPPVPTPSADAATGGGGVALALDEPVDGLAPGAIGEAHATQVHEIVGEGVAAEEAVASAAAVTATAAQAAPRFRFSRMGPKGNRPSKAIRARVAREMSEAGGGSSSIPAGYTYLGQFIDHDLTFDVTKVTLGENVTPAGLEQARSPSLDLDSLYGAGPDEEASERFYQGDGRRLKVGKTDAAGTGRLAARQGFDLPRSPNRRKPDIPDPRNDENLAVAQTHLAFIRFHNRVVDALGDVPAGQRFARARRSVVKHYQWMIRHDYLPRICDPAVVDDVYANGRKAFEVGVAPTDVPTMPIEFSVAAFRLGHSMIRKAYDWNREFPDGQGTLDQLFAFSSTGGFLGKGARLPSNWIADWRRLYRFQQAELQVPEAKFNRAMRIDTRLVDPLAALPPGSFGARDFPSDPLQANLAFRNLTRAKMLRLATGQQMAAFLRSKGVPVATLTRAQIRDGVNGADLSRLTAAQRDAFLDDTPLWFYVLREAEFNDGKLAGIGARIVAETVHRAMEGSRASIVRDPSFKPRFGPDDATFDMRDLLLFAFEGKKELLNPLGG